VTAEMIALAPGLVVFKPGAGVDNIDVTAADSRGIVVTNVPGARGRAVAEHALFLMTYLARHAWLRDDPSWQGTTSVQLGGGTLGVVGLGAIGSHLARFGHGLGMRVLVNTRTPDPARLPGVPVEFVDLDGLLRGSDSVVLCPPLTDETRGMIDAAALAVMRHDAFLVNVARGPIVVTEDLLAALRGPDLGAGLDVTDPSRCPRMRAPRAAERPLSPHRRTHSSRRPGLERMRANVLAVLAGEPPLDRSRPSSRLERAHHGAQHR
jgi:D-3-phosphoglycerate dehydrogenase